MTTPNHVTTINIANNNHGSRNLHQGPSSNQNVQQLFANGKLTTVNRSGLGHEGKYTPSASLASVPTSASRLGLSSMTNLSHMGYNDSQNFLNNNSHGNYVDIDQLDQMRYNGPGEPNAGGQQSYFPSFSFMRNYSINQKHPPASLEISSAGGGPTGGGSAYKLSPTTNGSAMALLYGVSGGGGGDESPIYENQSTINNLQRAESPIYSNTSSQSSVAIQSLNNLHQRSLYDYQTEQNIRNVLNLAQQQANYPAPPVFPQLRYTASPTQPNASSSSSQSLYSNLPPSSSNTNYYNNVLPSAASLMMNVRRGIVNGLEKSFSLVVINSRWCTRTWASRSRAAG